VYTGHDDGWYNAVYYNNILDFNYMIGSVIVDKIERIFDIKLPQFTEEFSLEFRELAGRGIAIDLMRLMVEEDGSIIIPIYVFGPTHDMDEVYLNCRDNDVEVDYELRFSGDWVLVETIG